MQGENVTPIAILVNRDNITFAGLANTYQLDPPLRGYQFVTVFIEPGYGPVAPRATVVPKRIDETPMLNAPLPGSFSLQHEVTIDEAAWWALQTAGGYEIVIPEPIPVEED